MKRKGFAEEREKEKEWKENGNIPRENGVAKDKKEKKRE